MAFCRSINEVRAIEVRDKVMDITLRNAILFFLVIFKCYVCGTKFWQTNILQTLFIILELFLAGRHGLLASASLISLQNCYFSNSSINFTNFVCFLQHLVRCVLHAENWLESSATIVLVKNHSLCNLILFLNKLH